MNFPENIYYTKEHEWVKLESENIALVGITDFAQRELGDIVYVDVDSIGKSLKAQAIFGTIEAVKTVSDLFLPVEATVLEMNTDLSANPQFVNEDPYGKGWLIRVKFNNPKELQQLLKADDYQKLVG